MAQTDLGNICSDCRSFLGLSLTERFTDSSWPDVMMRVYVHLKGLRKAIWVSACSVFCSYRTVHWYRCCGRLYDLTTVSVQRTVFSLDMTELLYSSAMTDLHLVPSLWFSSSTSASALCVCVCWRMRLCIQMCVMCRGTLNEWVNNCFSVHCAQPKAALWPACEVGSEKTLQHMMSPPCVSLCLVHLLSTLHSNQTTTQTVHFKLRSCSLQSVCNL